MVLMSLKIFNAGNHLINYEDIIDLKILNKENLKDTCKVYIFIKTKPQFHFSGKLQLAYIWNYYGWNLLSIKNVYYKKN